MSQETQTNDRLRKPERNEPVRTAPVDIYETKDELLIVADFPGVPSDALTVSLDGASLTIEGRQARGGLLRRSFHMPNTIDADRVAARTVDGVVTVQLPKRSDGKPRRIAVTAG